MRESKVSEPIIQEIKSELFEDKQVRVYVQREDLRHSFGMGNKWWKLKYNLEAYRDSKHERILSFGGAYSNHIHALAALCNEKSIPCIGVIRGEEPKNYSSTLEFAKGQGMHLYFVSRAEYRLKQHPDFISELRNKFGPCYVIPEGGSNQLAVRGASEMLSNHQQFDWVITPVGTGGTLAGIVSSLHPNQRALGISSLKGANDLKEAVMRFTSGTNFEINHDYHFGGYAKKTSLLESFMTQVKTNHSIPLDHVYTGKMFFGCFDLINTDNFKPNSNILLVHTGGLQGSTT